MTRRFTLACLCLLALAAPANAHESALRKYEEATLGPQHAAEHAVARAAIRRWSHMSPRARAAYDRAERDATRKTIARGLATGPPESVGRWTTKPFPLHGGGNGYAVHAALLHTGKVIYYGYTRSKHDGTDANNSLAWLWNPKKGTGRRAFKKVYPPRIMLHHKRTPAPIYCSGMSLLADGRLFIVGGNLARAPRLAGRNQAFLFDPETEKWTRVPRPKGSEGRWYPSQVRLGDGRVLTLSGYTQHGSEQKSKTIEIYTPPKPGTKGTGHFRLIKPEDSRSPGLYPHLWLMPSGNVFMGGPGGYDSWFLNPDESEPWFNENSDPSFDEKYPDDAFPKERGYSTGVLRPDGENFPSRVTLIGGVNYEDNSVGKSGDLATKTTETFDWSLDGTDLTGPHWEDDAPLNVARMNMNTVLLPDLTEVTIGGGAGEFGDAAEYSVVAPGERKDLRPRRQVELFDPAAGEWRLGPAQREDRAYHSTALLLPDGRVWSAGDDYHPHGGSKHGGWPVSDTGEIYSPPYLFKGERPKIVSTPRKLTWGENFAPVTSGPAVTRMVLASPSAVTHANDMNQRVIPLDFDGSMASVPSNPNVAPPGWYMLFVLTDNGVPSVAKWVQIS